MEPYQYVSNNPIMFTDPTGMSKEGGDGVDNRYKGVWNHCEKKYDYNLINTDGGNQVDTVEYQGGVMDGKTMDYPVFQDVQRYSQAGGSSGSRVNELERSPGYQKLSVNTFNGHAIQPVTVIGTLSDIAFDYFAETTGSPELTFALALFSANPKGFFGALSNGSKGEKLATKLMKFGDDGALPIPDIHKSQFKKAGGEIIHKETGAIYRQSNTTHRGKEGEYKIWPKGTTNFGKVSKTSGDRITTTNKGFIIGH